MEPSEPLKEIQARPLEAPLIVKTLELGPAHEAPLQALANYMQQIADIHAASLGVGMEALLRQRRAWMLAWMDIDIARMPDGREPLRIITWPAGRSRVYAFRAIRIRTEGGEELVAARTGWIVFDLDRQKPARVAEVVGHLLTPPDMPAIDGPEAKLPDMQRVDHELAVPLRLADLDINRHANNAALAQFAVEAVPEAVWSRRRLRHIELYFKAECRWPETVLSRVQQLEDGRLLHSLARQSDGREAVRAVSRWE